MGGITGKWWQREEGHLQSKITGGSTHRVKAEAVRDQVKGVLKSGVTLTRC